MYMSGRYGHVSHPFRGLLHLYIFYKGYWNLMFQQQGVSHVNKNYIHMKRLQPGRTHVQVVLSGWRWCPGGALPILIF